ncbi:opioid-binding protein/cell adhesion molecule homolog isoform X1 [Stylophora pistillata]|uniref:opioid-binding protein/cell adhesion molecule homolog isoform X1 n=1 Tax=Stylophora pistillata TaxID=50429 RepID=UPI000C05106C|nr:opioid-binding protein/cell adhesion molecule homolog isoform X1 [Stylophora pistillata]
MFETLGRCVIFVGLYPFAVAALKFSVMPNDPSYVKNGSTAKLVWDYSDPNNDLRGLIFSVLSKAGFKEMLVKQNGVVTEHPSIPSSYKGRVKMEGRATLVIEKITPKDNTRFKCILFDSYTDRGSEVHLIVAEKPQIDDLSVGKSYNEGFPVNVTCTSRGIPTPNVEWLRNGAVLSSARKTASLTFRNISRSDDGNYTCKACNSEGCDDFRIALVVKYPPKIQIVIVSSLASWVGQALTLKCQSDGVPTPTLTWYKPDGNEIFRVTNKEITVQVALKDSGDFGDYKCVAENGLTPRDERIVKLNQIKKPGAASIISTEADVQASSLTVRWTAPADDGGSPITAYRVIILKGDTKKGSVDITGLRETITLLRVWRDMQTTR